jgi:hypothetical protein
MRPRRHHHALEAIWRGSHREMPPRSSIDKAYGEIRPKMETDRECKGNFFPVSCALNLSAIYLLADFLNSQKPNDAQA